MVEMLGVLAIIGILSVGALAGYSKAMFQHKLNKQMEQINELLLGITKYQNDLYGLNQTSMMNILKKLHSVPEGMIQNESGTYWYDDFKNRVWVSPSTAEDIVLHISLSSLKDDNEAALRECQNIFTIAKEWASELCYFETISAASSENRRLKQYYGDRCCQSCSKIRNLNTQKIFEMCNFHSQNDTTSVSLKFWWRK